jgi:UDPglucose 6-dehydrogenase
VIVTEWARFRALDLQRLKREMAQPVVVDLRIFIDPTMLLLAASFTRVSDGDGQARSI